MLLVFGNDGVEELEIFLAARVLLLSWFALLLLGRRFDDILWLIIVFSLSHLISVAKVIALIKRLTIWSSLACLSFGLLLELSLNNSDTITAVIFFHFDLSLITEALITYLSF